MVLPSFIILFCISRFLDRFLEIVFIANAFKGIRVAVGLLILDAAHTMIKKMPAQLLARTIMLVSAAVMLLINVFAWNFSSISLMLIAAAVSLSVYIVQQRKGGVHP